MKIKDADILAKKDCFTFLLSQLFFHNEETADSLFVIVYYRAWYNGYCRKKRYTTTRVQILDESGLHFT